MRFHCRLMAALGAAALLAYGIDVSPATERREVSPEEFKQLVGEAEYARLLSEAFREADKRFASNAAFSIERVGSVVRFAGAISPESADALSNALASDEVRELWVESDGGDVEAGQRMGRVIRDRELVVVVTGACISSCANYLFTAGKRRVIRPDGFVVWHGSTLQKDGREFHQCGRVRSLFDGTTMTDDEIAELRNDAEGVKRRQKADADFFASIGVDEYITRVGQEPRFFGNFTMTIRDMARFGLNQIEAPPDYGEEAFCRRINARRPSLQLTCLVVSDDMLAYERARRAFGEVCAPDGSLVIATEASRKLGGYSK